MSRTAWTVFFGLGLLLAGGSAGAQCTLDVQVDYGRGEEEVRIQCNHLFHSEAVVGCCGRNCEGENRECERTPVRAWVEIDGQRVGDLSIQPVSVHCGPCCGCEVYGDWTISGSVTKREPCNGEIHRAFLVVRVRWGLGRGEGVLTEWTQSWQACRTPPPPAGICIEDERDPHHGDGCCDPRENHDPERGNNLNDACIGLFRLGGRACCRPVDRLPPRGDPTHPWDTPEGYNHRDPAYIGKWARPGWCDQCGGSELGCRSNDDCGPGQVCCNGTCVEGSSCQPPPPSGFDAVIEVIGSQGHRWNPALRTAAPPVPMSFRIWDLSGNYLWETDRACYNERGKRLGDVACWSRPWLVPDYAENPTGVVRTHRLHLTSPKSVYVQPECGVEFNAVLNPAKLARMYPEGGGPIVFHPRRGIRVDLAETTCPRRENVCADGRPCGKCPDGRWPLPDGTCPGGARPSGDACKDGSACRAACVYTIDLRNVYERRQTPSWCYEDPAKG